MKEPQKQPSLILKVMQTIVQCLDVGCLISDQIRLFFTVPGFYANDVAFNDKHKIRQFGQ
jgi:hypothetical protein